MNIFFTKDHSICTLFEMQSKATVNDENTPEYSNIISFHTGKPFQKGYKPLPEIWIGILPEIERVHPRIYEEFQTQLYFRLSNSMNPRENHRMKSVRSSSPLVGLFGCRLSVFFLSQASQAQSSEIKASKDVYAAGETIVVNLPGASVLGTHSIGPASYLKAHRTTMPVVLVSSFLTHAAALGPLKFSCQTIQKADWIRHGPNNPLCLGTIGS